MNGYSCSYRQDINKIIVKLLAFFVPPPTTSIKSSSYDVNFDRTGNLEPVGWSKGFVALAEALAQDFVSTRSLSPIKAVLLGPPGGDQNKVCVEVSHEHPRELVSVALHVHVSALSVCLLRV